MDIEVERRADVGVAQYDAHSLVVAVALDAACGKAVAQAESRTKLVWFLPRRSRFY